MKTILVTGGAGFIGSHFVDLLIDSKDYKIIVLDKLTYAGKKENMDSFIHSKKVSFLKADLCEFNIVKSIFDSNKIDYIVNFAAESHVDNSIVSPSIFINSNINGTHNLISLAKSYWEIEDNWKHNYRFIQVSTDEVYGMLGLEGTFTEENCLNPSSPYSASKAAADLICMSYYKTYGFPVIITRSSNNFGPRQDTEKLIPKSITNLLMSSPIKLYGNGENIRDWIYVKDNCLAILNIMSSGELGEIYNIGGKNELSNMTIARILLNKLSKSQDLIEFIDDRLGHDFRYSVDDTKTRKVIGNFNLTPFDNAINYTIDYYMRRNGK